MTQPEYPTQGNYPGVSGYPGYTTGPPAPGYPEPGSGYNPPGPPASQTGYPQGQPGYAGYPPPGGVPYGYPQSSAFPQRPGTATAAAVLAFVLGGLDIIGGAITFSALSAITLFTASWVSPTMILLGLAALGAGGVLIAGGVTMLRGGSTLLLVGSTLSGLLAVVWFVLANGLQSLVGGAGVSFVYGTIYLSLSILTACLAAGSIATKQWQAAREADVPPGLPTR